MRRLGLLVAIVMPLAAPAQATEIAPGVELPPGAEVETQLGGDFNGDGIGDLAFVVRNGDARALTVLLSVRYETDFAYSPEELGLEPTQFAPGSLSLTGDVLVFEDITGGTTAVSSTRRYRYDRRGKRMRLIGLDATVYSRTFAHDGFEASWNLLNGSATTRELKLNESGGDAAYNPGRKRSFNRRVGVLWLSTTPDPEIFLEEMRDG